MVQILALSPKDDTHKNKEINGSNLDGRTKRYTHIPWFKLRRKILTARLHIKFNLYDSGKRASITEEIEKRIAETIVSRK